MPDLPRLRSLIIAFQQSAAVHVAADLGLSDLLADGPRTVSDLAVATGTDEDTLHRLLRALATIGRAHGTVVRGPSLRSGSPGALGSPGGSGGSAGSGDDGLIRL